jgi:hypothetical protein
VLARSAGLFLAEQVWTLLRRHRFGARIVADVERLA